MAADFKPGVLTTRGLALLAKWQAGRCTPEITHAVIGSGSYTSGESIVGRTALKAQKLSVGLSRKEVQNNSTVLVRFIFGNETLTTGFKVTEVGIYATDPDIGEILYSIAVSADEANADYLPAYNGTYPSTIVFSYQIEVANAESVTIKAGTGGYAPADEFNDLVEKAEALQIEADATDTALRVLVQRVIQMDRIRQEDEADIQTLFQNTVGETGTVTLTNSKTYPFNSTVDSPTTVAIQTTRKSLNYVVDTEIVSYSGGLPGSVAVTDKQKNGFKISFDGSAKSVTIAYRIMGGMAK